MTLKLIVVAAGLLSAQTSWAAPMRSCRAPAGLREITSAQDAKFIIFGEEHGTEQSPEIVGDVACALSRKGERVLVALELQAREDAALQRAWSGPHADLTQTLMGTMPDWSTRKDGVASSAMLALVKRLHALKQQGQSIAVVAFNGIRDGAQATKLKTIPQPGRHEAAQAENIRRSVDAGRYDRIVVLVGSLHACKQRCHGIAYEPMAMRLAHANQIVSLLMRRGAGTAWNCQLRPGTNLVPGKPPAADALDCGIHTSPNKDDLLGQPRIVLADPASLSSAKGDYDGYYFVGHVTASAPAVGSR